MRKVIKNRL